MGYGLAEHLWVHGSPEPVVVRQWMEDALRTSFGGQLQFETVVADVYRFGPERLLVDVQKLGELVDVGAEQDGSTDFLFRLASLAEAAGYSSTRISMGKLGDMFWDIETTGPNPAGAELQGKKMSTLSADGWRADPDAAALARTIIGNIVKLPLVEVYHYIEWADEARYAIEEKRPVEGFPSAEISQPIPTLYLVWNGKRLPHCKTSEEMAPEFAEQERQKTEREERHAASLKAQSGLVWAFVLAIGVVVPGFIYYAMFFPPAPKVGASLVLVGIITFFWFLFSLVGFNGRSGKPVPWLHRAAVLVGGELGMACLMWAIFSVVSGGGL